MATAQPCSGEWPHDVTAGLDTSPLNQGLLRDAPLLLFLMAFIPGLRVKLKDISLLTTKETLTFKLKREKGSLPQRTSSPLELGSLVPWSPRTPARPSRSPAKPLGWAREDEGRSETLPPLLWVGVLRKDGAGLPGGTF